ncbi:MAG: hypothetical protein ACRDPL_06080, partial [Propionibacteriaceae bacterium]
GEQRLASDASTFSEWLAAKSANDAQLQAMLVRRFSPEYRTAFGGLAEDSTVHHAQYGFLFNQSGAGSARPGTPERLTSRAAGYQALATVF